MEKFIKERIEENIKLFNNEESKILKQNFHLIKKIYILGCLNMKEIYITK